MPIRPPSNSRSGPWRRSLSDGIRGIATRCVDAYGLWQFRSGTGNFAWAGVDMALWDICGHACNEPLWRLLGGLQEKEATYFYYLSRGDREALEAQVSDGLAAGFEVFYLKVGLDDADDADAVSAVRTALGPQPRLRLDANGSWTVPQALRNLRTLAAHDIDFVEQPVRDHPVGQLGEIQARAETAVCSNEGLWSEAGVRAHPSARRRRLRLSPYWVGSIGGFQRLSWLAHYEGLQICKHTHGELGLAAAASHHVVLTLPNGVEGHQQTAYLMEHDILAEPIPISTGPGGDDRPSRSRRGRR